ncbi:tRNA (adenosine(37)-N6)-threonylcarbamoyltransferase complex dimerization subunit type 1 TsaB [Candidatus Microgenomates bacterium]|nr:tRNA (adenosine(37)-N6)-threonylcarbamoyltransferase complex dimerization subunit type 1 TsaB [Candidatus Microgenomates bacterium]
MSTLSKTKSILLLDTIGDKIVLGFWDGKKLRTKTLKKDLAHKLHSGIKSLILTTGYLIQDIDAIGVINGPGSFTGVRTGVTIANALAYALKVPIYAIDSLTAQAPLEISKTFPTQGSTLKDAPRSNLGSKKITRNHKRDTVTIILPASHTEVYTATFKNGKMVGEITLAPKVGAIHESPLQKSDKRIKNLLQMILSKKIKPQKKVRPLYIKKPNITTSNKKIRN